MTIPISKMPLEALSAWIRNSEFPDDILQLILNDFKQEILDSVEKGKV